MKVKNSKVFNRILQQSRGHELIEILLSGTKSIDTFKTKRSKMDVDVFVKGSIEVDGETYIVGIADA